MTTTTDFQSPEGLASSPEWLRGVTDPAQRLVAARAYRAHPDQGKTRTARGERYVAAVLALGEPPDVAECFRNYAPASLEQARKMATSRRERAKQESEHAAFVAAKKDEREQYWASPAGRRKARRLAGKAYQLWYLCSPDGCTMYVSNRVLHALRKTPVAGRLTFFENGTVGETVQAGLRVWENPVTARRELVRKLLREPCHKPSPVAVCRMPELAEVDQTAADAWLARHILPWARRQLAHA